MPELLLELLSEEIPARMQRRAAEDLKKLVLDAFKEARLDVGSTTVMAGPRRVALIVEGLPSHQPAIRIERKGPRADAPAAAIDGFLKSVGLRRDQVEERDAGKARVLFAVIDQPGRPTTDLLMTLLPTALAALPWPKSMRWGANDIRWVRPLHLILCLFDGAVVPFAFGHLTAGEMTAGHRFHQPHRIVVKNVNDYRLYLDAAKVMVDGDERKRRIRAEAERLAQAEGLWPDLDEALLEEIAGLVEYPVVLIGSIDRTFLVVPPEVLIAVMRKHQRYIPLRSAEGKLAARFIVVANLLAQDGGKAIVAGNERVLRARFADAKFFWDQDRARPLRANVLELEEIVFHADIGTLAEKVYRMEIMVPDVVKLVPGAVQADVTNAVRLCKADLLSGMVGEFPELQGVMGRYYAVNDREPDDVAQAIAEHYAPLGPHDRCPTQPTSVALALLDKVYTLVSMFAVGLRPTGSKDPFALRRAALGIIRLILENKLRVPLKALIKAVPRPARKAVAIDDALADELLAFFADRLKVHLKEKGVRHDLIAAVFALTGEDDLVRLLVRVEALAAFLASDDGANLLTAYRRAANIVRIEEKKDGTRYSGGADPTLLVQDEEHSLVERLTEVAARSRAALAAEDFAGAMTALASLRRPVDTFFDRVTVNVDDPGLRRNRLRLLAETRTALDTVADFAAIEG
ncbi:MAG: glycine--tRNA ligase subunit beta [Alphaproteobacteria bacterium]|nr:glycine--tRNA ligase subunit beta [Alphaproteobacteria bacterium]